MVEMVKGVCNNPNSYYFGTAVESDFEAEECGMKKCGNCIHFISEENLRYQVEREFELERERDRLERLFGLW